MSMHSTVAEVFNGEFALSHPNITLSNSDVNRIVTATVQTFNLEEDAKVQISVNIENYITKYKTRKTGGCGCNKK